MVRLGRLPRPPIMRWRRVPSGTTRRRREFDAMRRALVADLSRHFPLTRVRPRLAWFSYAAIARTPRWTGGSPPLLPSRIRKTTRRTTGRRRLVGQASSRRGHARTTRRRSAPRQKGRRPGPGIGRGPLPAQPRAPHRPRYACPSPRTPRCRRSTARRSWTASASPPPSSRPPVRAKASEPSRTAGSTRRRATTSRRLLRCTRSPREPRAREGTQPRPRGDGRRPPSTRVPPVALSVVRSRRREKEETRVWSRPRRRKRRIHIRRKRRIHTRHTTNTTTTTPRVHGRVRGTSRQTARRVPPLPRSATRYSTMRDRRSTSLTQSRGTTLERAARRRRLSGTRPPRSCATRCGAPTPWSWSCRGPT